MAQSKDPLHRAPRGARAVASDGLAFEGPAVAPVRGAVRFVAAAAAATIAALLLGGCVYRIDIQQGNVIEQESVDQVEVGMTRSQVQFLLGTPMVSDPFHEDRWDYTYWYRQGRQRSVERRWLTIYFEDDRVARIEHQVAPTEGAEPASAT